MKHWLVAMLLALSAMPVAQAQNYMEALPPVEAGVVRHVLEAPKEDDEPAFRVELAVGKTVQTDPHNRYFFGGGILQETIEGRGVPRFLVSALGPMAGTLTAVDPAAPKVDRFITLGGEPFLTRYNGRRPVVVWVPEGAEARYRIWSAGSALKPMKQC